MLDRISARNFRCFREFDVPLRPLTVLIGPNDSGKSTFLAALEYLASANRHYVPEDAWRFTSEEIDLHGWGQGFDVRFARPGTQRTRDQGGRPLPDRTWPVGLYQLPSHGIELVSLGLADSKPLPTLGPRGEMVPALLDYLLRRDRRRFDACVDALRSRIPGLEDVNIATPSAEHRRIDLVVENGLVLPPDRISAGVRLMLFYLALMYHPSPPKMILLEEPETGVHPKRLEDIVKLLRDITQGRNSGVQAQVVLTTHSPYLLDYVDPKEDQVLVFRREDDGSRSVNPVDVERLKVFLDGFMLGEVWYNEGEEGLLTRQHDDASALRG